MKEEREAHEEKENEQLVNYNFLGSEECPVDPDNDEIEYSMIFRIPRIEALEQCHNLRVCLCILRYKCVETWSKEEPD